MEFNNVLILKFDLLITMQLINIEPKLKANEKNRYHFFTHDYWDIC